MKIYVILPPAAIGEVMRGERTTLPVIDPAPIGAILAVKRARNRRPTLHLQVTDCQPDPDGHTLTIRTIPNEHEPLLLAADSTRGYTNDPRLAMTGEPEAIPLTALAKHWQQHAQGRHAKARTATDRRRRARTLESQVRFLAMADHPAADQIEALLKQTTDQEAA